MSKGSRQRFKKSVITITAGQALRHPDRPGILQDWERFKLNLHSDAFNYVEESAVCGSQETYIYPRTARNTRRQWRFVVNILGDEGGQQQQQGEDYVQAVKIEKCLRAGEACNLDNSGLQQTVCRSQAAFMLTSCVENIFYSDKNIPTPN